MVTEAKDFVKKQVLLQPDVKRTLSPETRSTERDNPGESDFEPDWSTAQTCSVGGYEVTLFTLKEGDTPLCGYVYTRVNGKRGRSVSQATSKLAIWKVKGRMVGRIITYLPDKRFLKDGGKVEKLGYQMKGTGYTGFRIVSTMDGKILFGDKFTKGKHAFHFVPNTHRHEEGKSLKIGSRPWPVKNDSLPAPHIYLSLFSKPGKAQSRLGSYSSFEQDNLRCSFCGKLVDDCFCFVVTPKPDEDRCPDCGGILGDCECNKEDNWGFGKEEEKEDNGNTGGGGGGGGISKPKPETSLSKALLLMSYPAAWFIGYDNSLGLDCYKLSNRILQQLLPGYVDNGVYQIKKMENGTIRKTGTAKDAFDIINEHLNSKRPIKVGVDYKKGGNRSDGLTDHWVIINGRGYDYKREQYYFRYIETGRYKQSANYAVGDNRLYYDPTSDKISGKKWNNVQTYELTRIIKNK